uniref:Uncharacterized protein n=1 Tax=Cacopsylla melanoneura TaxID=428564 RepID=A0A8D8QVY5_9HEMI
MRNRTLITSVRSEKSPLSCCRTLEFSRQTLCSTRTQQPILCFLLSSLSGSLELSNRCNSCTTTVTPPFLRNTRCSFTSSVITLSCVRHENRTRDSSSGTLLVVLLLWSNSSSRTRITEDSS